MGTVTSTNGFLCPLCKEDSSKIIDSLYYCQNCFICISNEFFVLCCNCSQALEKCKKCGRSIMSGNEMIEVFLNASSKMEKTKFFLHDIRSQMKDKDKYTMLKMCQMK